MKRQYRHKQDGRQLDEEGCPNEDAHDEQWQPDLAAKSHHGKEPRPELHRNVARGVLDSVSDLVRSYAHRSYGSVREVVLRESDNLTPRVVVVRELSWHRLDADVGQAVAVEYHARRLGACKTTRTRLLRILRVRTPNPERSDPRNGGPNDHHEYVA